MTSFSPPLSPKIPTERCFETTTAEDIYTCSRPKEEDGVHPYSLPSQNVSRCLPTRDTGGQQPSVSAGTQQVFACCTVCTFGSRIDSPSFFLCCLSQPIKPTAGCRPLCTSLRARPTCGSADPIWSGRGVGLLLLPRAKHDRAEDVYHIYIL